jgi:hypothetical protein
MKYIRKNIFLLILSGLVLAVTPLTARATQSTNTSKDTSSRAAARPPTSQEIDDAKSKGMVWVNTSTHVYHQRDSTLYGKTKRGKFMTEDDAKKGGFRPANEAGTRKKSAGQTATNPK